MLYEAEVGAFPGLRCFYKTLGVAANNDLEAPIVYLLIFNNVKQFKAQCVAKKKKKKCFLHSGFAPERKKTYTSSLMTRSFIVYIIT